MFDIITIGSATRDAFFEGIDYEYLNDKQAAQGRALCLPLGAKMHVEHVTFTSGGAGTNAAVTFARLGLKTSAIVRVGEDVSGEEVTRNLAREGVDTSLVQKHSSLPTSYSVVLMAEKAERTILVFKGAGGTIDASMVPWESIKTTWFYLNSLSQNEELLKHVGFFKLEAQLPMLQRQDKDQGVKIAWNPGTDDLAMGIERLAPYLALVDVFIINGEEASVLFGIPLEERDALFRAIDNVISGIAIMTMGPRGVMVSDGKTLYLAGLFPEKQLVDRTGAGDAFGSGFVYGYTHGGIEEGIRVGSANSTSVLEHIGAKEGILRLEELNDERWKGLKIEAHPLK